MNKYVLQSAGLLCIILVLYKYNRVKPTNCCADVCAIHHVMRLISCRLSNFSIISFICVDIAMAFIFVVIIVEPLQIQTYMYI